ncbi:hypothetical protein V6N11_075953 [Hibiscus sabdariffa]|uniref:EF-hand domain-containing protein n=1 Tax=Hibiscus sabdariffa TaxID=183260 RepID=A0ABR2Q4T4_9ROSI
MGLPPIVLHGDDAGYRGPSQHGKLEMTVDEFKAWHRHFDAKHDGWIDGEELKEALHSPKVRFGWWKARQGMKEADCNQSTMKVN